MSPSTPPSFSGYTYAGVRALVQLHDRHLRAFVSAWEQAARDGIRLPRTDDPTCASLPALLHHVLRAARGYMIWICECLGLEDPQIREAPSTLPEDLAGYVEHLLARWDGPLRQVEERATEERAYPSRWGPPYCIDAMLEHAVMHPLRHAYQLERAREACRQA